MKLARAALVLVPLLLPVAAQATEPTIDEKVRYLLTDILGSDSENTLNETVRSTIMSHSSGTSPEVVDRMIAVMGEELSKEPDDRLSIYIETYKSIYTIDEINSAYSFYTTPVGRTMIAKQGAFVEKVGAALADQAMAQFGRLTKALHSDPELQRLMAKPRNDP